MGLGVSGSSFDVGRMPTAAIYRREHELTLSDILRVEDSTDVLEVRCPDTDIPLWSTIRTRFLRLIMGDLLYGVPLVGRGPVRRSGSRLRVLATISRSYAHNALRSRAVKQHYPIVLIPTGARLIEREGRYFNCLSDYFVSAVPDCTLVVEDLFGWKWPFPRHHSNVLLKTPLLVEGELRSRLRVSDYRKSARELVDLMAQRARKLFGWNVGEERFKWLEKLCAIEAASLTPRYRKYQSIFKRTGARLLLKEEGCYGGPDDSSAIFAARTLGMVTAEYQHGAVSSGHDAYNFAPAILNNDNYRQILPDFFLTYGSWWGEQINAPVEKLAIGNPHRAETLGGSSSDSSRGRRILVLGDGIETALYLELCERLAVTLGSRREVVFRPHPLERDSVLANHSGGFAGKVNVDAHEDLYESFREAAAVVSEVSTGLFEAIGLVPRIYIWDTPKARYSYPVHPFHRFSDADELAHLILEKSAGRVSPADMESIWAPNWRRNYLAFIGRAGIQPG